MVRNAETLERMATVLAQGQVLRSAALGIAVCGDLDVAQDGHISYLLQDCAAAIENLLLCASALGLGACWLGVHPREDRIKAMKELLSLPASVVPVACISLGHPAELKQPRATYERACVHFEKWAS